MTPSRIPIHAHRLKRLVDIVFSLVLFLLLSPLLLGISAILATQGFSPFFSHERIGKEGRPFRCYKFRTMVPNASILLHEYLRTHPEAEREWRATHKLSNDPRITRLGKWMRKLSLDELPQLWNILTGEMSLVGPRPITAEELVRYRDNAAYYIACRPGLTGLWQVQGRSHTPYRYRVFLDGWYATHWSLCLDILIIIKTIPAVLWMKGAH